MTNSGPNVRLSADLIERCEAYGRDVVAFYRRNGDRVSAMPWTSDQMTDEELRQWLASRAEAGRKIDIETCELGRWHANDCDPYGIREMLGELNEEMFQIGTNRFVRSVDSNGWVHEGDLPGDKGCAMYDRIHREWEAYQRLRNIAADMFNSETRRGWLANGCSSLGSDVNPGITEQEYIERYVEQNKGRDLGELEEMADIARPSNLPTAYERERLARS
jgi:hypothetical protein